MDTIDDSDSPDSGPHYATCTRRRQRTSSSRYVAPRRRNRLTRPTDSGHVRFRRRTDGGVSQAVSDSDETGCRQAGEQFGIKRRRNFASQYWHLMSSGEEEEEEEDGVGTKCRCKMCYVDSLVRDAASRVSRAKQAAAERVHHAIDDAAATMHNAESIAHDVYIKLREEWRACHFDMLPAWMKHNEHLLCGHRPPLESFGECFKSIFRIHTETGNIWTHLIGFFVFLCLTVVFFIRPLCTTCKLDIDLSEKLIFLVFFMTAMVCLACSTLFHTVSCHSHRISVLFGRLDYMGIAALIVGSIIPWLYYSFYCDYYARTIYMVSISVFGIIVGLLSLSDRFNTPEFRVQRATIFVSLAMLSVIPVVHYIWQKGYAVSVDEASLHSMLVMGSLYITGAILYASRIPERWMPGRFDIWLQSHQLFHVLVIVAAIVHYNGIADMARYRLIQGPNCMTSRGMWSHLDPLANVHGPVVNIVQAPS